MVKKTFRVTGMQCPACAMRIEGLEDDLEGVAGIRANYTKAVVEIEFDDTRIDLDRIIRSAGAMGYRLEEVF